VGNVPLGIEFVVGQLKAGKDLGKIKSELEGFPSVEKAEDDYERKKRLSQIILFSFENMYETLDKAHQVVFQTIAVLHKNKKSSEVASIDILMTLTSVPKLKLEYILENLEDYKLIARNSGQYIISPMALNFVRQNYSFEEFENSLMPTFRAVVTNQPISAADRLLGEVERLINENKYQDAEDYLDKFLEDFFEDKLDYAKLHYHLAIVQKFLQKFKKAALSFEKATNLDQRNSKIWFDRIIFEGDRARHDIAILLCEQALSHTNHDVSILNQLLNIYKYKQNWKQLRITAHSYLDIYKKNNRVEDSIRLLRSWKQMELNLVKNGSDIQKYLEVSNKLIEIEEDKEIRLQIMREILNVVTKRRFHNLIKTYREKIYILENKIRGSISSRVQLLNKLWNDKEYEKATSEARKILSWFDRNVTSDDIYEFKSALRVLLQILSSEKKFDSIVSTFEEYPSLGYNDDNSKQVYEKAKRSIIEEKREMDVKNISSNLQEAEINLRSIIMFTFNYQETELVPFLIAKGKQDWVDQWSLNKRKSLKDNLEIIHFSDLSHIRSLYSWRKSNLTNSMQGIAKPFLPLLDSITSSLEHQISSKRNDTFHSRLQLEAYSDVEIREIDVDISRFFEYTKKIMEILNIRRI
jgi:tetratricopeptide (TPR) repeat protein